MRLLIILLLTSVQCVPSVLAQQTLLIPRDSVTLTLDTNRISVNYGRPSMRGRSIMGGLVPWDKVWRTGANEATHLTTNFDMVMGGVPVPRGTFTLWSLPSAKGWKLILNKQKGQWGTRYDERLDLARFDARVEHLDSPIDTFTIALEATGKESGILRLLWEHTAVSTTFQKSDTIRPISPLDSAETQIHGRPVSIRYSRPYMRGRSIWGVVVPNDSVWRTGANQATLLTTGIDLAIGETAVPRGSYTLYSVPTDKDFTLIISKKPAGQAQYDSTLDLARVKMQYGKSDRLIDPFTIWFERQADSNDATLKLGWADRVYSVRVSPVLHLQD